MVVAGPVKGSSAFTLVKPPPTHKIRISNGYIGQGCEAPDIAGVFDGYVLLDLVDPPVVRGVLCKGPRAIGYL